MEEDYRYDGMLPYADRKSLRARVRGFTFSFFTIK